METNERASVINLSGVQSLTVTLNEEIDNATSQLVIIDEVQQTDDKKEIAEESSLKDILKQNREKMMQDVKGLELLAEKVSDLIPTEYNYKTAGHFLLDRVRVMTEFHKTILNYRSEIERVTVDEIKLVTDENKTTSNAKDILTTISELPVAEVKKLLGVN